MIGWKKENTWVILFDKTLYSGHLAIVETFLRNLSALGSFNCMKLLINDFNCDFGNHLALAPGAST